MGTEGVQGCVTTSSAHVQYVLADIEGAPKPKMQETRQMEVITRTVSATLAVSPCYSYECKRAGTLTAGFALVLVRDRGRRHGVHACRLAGSSVML